VGGWVARFMENLQTEVLEMETSISDVCVCVCVCG